MAKVSLWHKPEFAESSAIRSLPGDNPTFSGPGSTLQQCNTPAPNSLGAAVVHHIGLRTAEHDACRPPYFKYKGGPITCATAQTYMARTPPSTWISEPVM
jgi:hypothetical protein